MTQQPPPSGYLPPKLENIYLYRYMHPMFIAALFTVAKTKKQSSVLQQMIGQRRCGTYAQWNTTQPQER